MTVYKEDSEPGGYDHLYDNGWFHKDDYNVDDARDSLMNLLEALYVTGDVEDLETEVGNLTKYLNVFDDYTDLKFVPKHRHDIFQWYLGYQRATIENMREAR